MRAIDAAGTPLAWSAAGSFQKRSSVPVPQAPAASVGLPCCAGTPTSLRGAYDVEVYRASTPPSRRAAGRDGERDRPPVPVRSYGRAAGDTYSWRVRPGRCRRQDGTVVDAGAPFTVGGDSRCSRARRRASVPSTSLRFGWAEVPGAVRYRVETS